MFVATTRDRYKGGRDVTGSLALAGGISSRTATQKYLFDIKFTSLLCCSPKGLSVTQQIMALIYISTWAPAINSTMGLCILHFLGKRAWWIWLLTEGKPWETFGRQCSRYLLYQINSNFIFTWATATSANIFMLQSLCQEEIFNSKWSLGGKKLNMSLQRRKEWSGVCSWSNEIAGILTMETSTFTWAN